MMGKDFEIVLCPKGQKLLDAYKKLKNQVEVIYSPRHGKTLHNLNKIQALKKYVDHRNKCKKCWDSRQGRENE
jgi:hypothetical protein